MIDAFDIQYKNADPGRVGVLLPDGIGPSGTTQREGLLSTTTRTPRSIGSGYRLPSGGGADPGGPVRFTRHPRALVGCVATLLTASGGVSPC